MSNHEIITLEALKRGYIYNSNNIHTYGEWLDLGYVPGKGQKAFIKTRIWTKGINKRKVLVGLFTVDQVVSITSKNLISI